MEALRRGHIARTWRARQEGAAVTIQKMFYQFVARRCSQQRRAEREAQRKHALFCYFAEQMQRIVRGYISRLQGERNDFYARKRYIQSVIDAGDELRARLVVRETEQRKVEAEMREAKAYKAFVAKNRDRHHLMGTRTQPGIYGGSVRRKHTAGPETDGAVGGVKLPHIFGKPVEEHLALGAKQFIKENGLNASTKRATKRLHSLPALRGSVRASGPYGVEQEERKYQERMLKYRALAGNFTAGSATVPEMPHDFLNSSTKFVDMRIATLNAKQLMEKDKSKFMGGAFNATVAAAIYRKDGMFDDGGMPLGM
jgi:hypothetical protein